MQTLNGLKEFLQSLGFQTEFERLEVNRQILRELSCATNPLFGQQTQNCVRITILLLQLAPLLNRPCGLANAVYRIAEVAQNPGSAVARDYQLLQFL